MTRRRASLGLKVAAALAVVVVVLVGIWVSGGLITNHFGLAMALTGAWMALAAAGCILIAWRRRDLRVPVLGAYLITVAVVGAYLGRSQFLDDEVNEKVVRVTPGASDSGPGGSERPRNVMLARGRFESIAH
jgi:hypothetical protein